MDRLLNRLFKYQRVDFFEAIAFSLGYWGLAFVLSNTVFSIIKYLYLSLMILGFVLICVLNNLLPNKKGKS